jgi:hypothetical protein
VVVVKVIVMRQRGEENEGKREERSEMVCNVVKMIRTQGDRDLIVPQLSDA